MEDAPYEHGRDAVKVYDHDVDDTSCWVFDNHSCQVYRNAVKVEEGHGHVEDTDSMVAHYLVHIQKCIRKAWSEMKGRVLIGLNILVLAQGENLPTRSSE